MPSFLSFLRFEKFVLEGRGDTSEFAGTDAVIRQWTYTTTASSCINILITIRDIRSALDSNLLRYGLISLMVVLNWRELSFAHALKDNT